MAEVREERTRRLVRLAEMQAWTPELLEVLRRECRSWRLSFSHYDSPGELAEFLEGVLEQKED